MKPPKATWIMSHPTYELELTLCEAMVGANGTNRIYLVQGEDEATQDKLIEGLDSVYQANCGLTCSSGGHFAIWPMKVGSAENVHIAHSTARAAFDASKTDFIKVWWAGNDVGYEFKHPASTETYAKKSPVWPKEQTWLDILGKGFKTQTISNLEHPVYLTAIGKH